jgi:signal transduction histidine kinase
VRIKETSRVSKSGRYLFRYGVAALLTAVALLLRLAFNPILRSQIPFATFYPAVLLSAWFLGRGPGFAACALSTILAIVFINPPVGLSHGGAPAQIIGIFLFLGFAIVLVLLVDTALAAKEKASRSEAEIRSLNEGLHARVRDFETLLDVAPIALFVAYDRTGAEVKMNATGAALIGMKPGDNPSKTGPDAEKLRYHLFKNGHEVAAESLPLQVAVREGAIIRGEELELLRPDGEWRYIVAAAAPLHDSNGAVSGAVAALQDVTALKKAQAEAARQAKEIARSSEDLRQFAYAASHDLQEPLRTVITYAQLIERRYGQQFDEDGHVFLDFVISSGKRLQRLLNDLREYWRIGVPEENPAQPVDSAAALAAAVANLAAALDDAGATVTVGELPAVVAHDVALVQLFQNLLGNAVKYRSEAPLVIDIQAAVKGVFCEFQVKDNGRGIDPRHHDHIFEIFQRLDDRPRSGSGMGLALCRKIVERYQGRIWVESQFGQGCCFRFTLPAVQTGSEHVAEPLV